MKAKLGLCLAGVLSLVPFLPAQSSTKGTVVDALVRINDFNTLARAAILTGLLDDLAEAESITVFAPTDEAFANVPEEILAALVADQELLADVLRYHIVPVEAFAADAAMLDSAPTLLEGQSVTITGDLMSGLQIDDANVIFADIDVGNGVIHVIDQVLVPEL